MNLHVSHESTSDAHSNTWHTLYYITNPHVSHASTSHTHSIASRTRHTHSTTPPALYNITHPQVPHTLLLDTHSTTSRIHMSHTLYYLTHTLLHHVCHDTHISHVVTTVDMTWHVFSIFISDCMRDKTHVIYTDSLYAWLNMITTVDVTHCILCTTRL